MQKDLIQVLKKLADVPEEKEAFKTWLQMQDVLEFLRENVESEDFAVYCTTEFAYLHALLVPRAAVEPPDLEDLLSWNLDVSASWSVWSSMSDSPEICMRAPLEDSNVKSFVRGEQLVFSRYFEGRLGDKRYFEILQKFVHVLGLHFLDERKAYCRLDKRGDIEEVIRFIETPGVGEKMGMTIITFRNSMLERYAALTDSVIIRAFDFTRLPENQLGWSDGIETKVTDADLIYRLHMEPKAAYIRGVQILKPGITKESAVSFLFDGEPEEKCYEAFLAQDWKNKGLREISCAPGATANYFTKSDLPFEMTPAFFRPEVLLKYKADPDKYRIENRSISCRGTWSLETYDINKIGQVHTYLVYLRALPFEEQQHWKAYNEPPKAPISERAFASDFNGQWSNFDDPLESIKHKLRDWTKKCVPWWTPRTPNAFELVHYPVTSSADEWANEMLHLDQLIVEGFQKAWLKQRAQDLTRTLDSSWGTLKLIEECLLGLGFEELDAKSIMASLQTLHNLRSKLKGHASGDEAVKLKQKAIKECQSYKSHFEELCRQCLKSMETMERALGKRAVNGPSLES